VDRLRPVLAGGPEGWQGALKPQAPDAAGGANEPVASGRGREWTMSELRRDPIVERWVIVAPERLRRPAELVWPQELPDQKLCPFCEGNEAQTPPEILAYRQRGSSPNGPGWRVRVVPNRFPALRVEGQLQSRPYGIYDVVEGVGAHEVIIETPQHVPNIAGLSEQQLREVARAYRDRLADLTRDVRLVYGAVFKNVGLQAGASLYHTHSQLIATPMIPPAIQEELRGARRYHETRGRCVYCDMIYEELEREERVVVDLPQVVAFCPYAARCPFEVWLLPKPHASHFETVSEVLIEELSTAFKIVLSKLEVALERPPYNFYLHTGPFRTGPLAYYHWHVEILPRITGLAGFELGTEMYINPVPPELAADFLREADIEALSNGRPQLSPTRSERERLRGPVFRI
jgi:UDPglucose--hexose-1-phosphate uridylyltransferase